MAKKSVSAAPAASPEVPAKSKSRLNNLPCALRYFWEYAGNAWGNCEAYLDQFAAKSPRFTKDYIAEKLAYIEAVRGLPDSSVRSSMKTKVGLALAAHRQLVVGQANLLANAIAYTYREQPALIPVERKLAGIEALRGATEKDWAAVSAFIGTANKYLQDDSGKLVAAGAISAEFAAGFEAVGIGFNAAWKEYVAKRQTAREGTQSVADGIKRILLDLNPMLDLGKQLFEYDPAVRKLFMMEYLVAEVRGGHSAGIRGRMFWEGTDQPVSGAVAMVVGTNKTAMADAKGRYLLKLSVGEYVVRYSAPGAVPIEQSFSLVAGVVRRRNIALLPSSEENEGPADPGDLDAAAESLNSYMQTPSNGAAPASELAE